jgi:ankyrin repeat protein
MAAYKNELYFGHDDGRTNVRPSEKVVPTYDDIFGSIKKGDLNSVKAIIEQGWDYSLPGHEILLPYAVQCGFLDIVKYLVSKGCDPKKYALLAKCSRGKKLAIAKYLIEVGCDPAANGNEALCDAIKANSSDMTMFFIEHGCNVTVNQCEAFWLSLDLSDRRIFKLMFSLATKRDQCKFLATKNPKQVMYIDFFLQLEREGYYNGKQKGTTRVAATGFEKTIVDWDGAKEEGVQQNGLREKFVLQNARRKNNYLKSILKPTSLFIQFTYFE